MPITDYRAVEAAVVAPIAWYKLRAIWSRIKNRGPESVEGHRVL